MYSVAGIQERGEALGVYLPEVPKQNSTRISQALEHDPAPIR
jgi:hypothetical protein